MKEILHYPAGKTSIDEESLLLLLLRGLECFGEGNEGPEERPDGCILFHNNIYCRE
jgi:hypothetical protein